MHWVLWRFLASDLIWSHCCVGNGLKEDRSGNGKIGDKAVLEIFHTRDDSILDWYGDSEDRENWDEFEDKIDMHAAFGVVTEGEMLRMTPGFSVWATE